MGTARRTAITTLVAGGIIVLALALWKLRLVVALLFFAIIIASAMRPSIDWLARHRIPRPAGVALHYLALLGAISELGEAVARLPAGGSEAIPAIRSLQRRLLMLAPARARVERGERVDGVMASLGKSLFWKDKPAVEKMLRTWTAADLGAIAQRAGALERSLMFSNAPAREALGEELLTIARKARSRPA